MFVARDNARRSDVFSRASRWHGRHMPNTGTKPGGTPPGAPPRVGMMVGAQQAVGVHRRWPSLVSQVIMPQVVNVSPPCCSEPTTPGGTACSTQRLFFFFFCRQQPQKVDRRLNAAKVVEPTPMAWVVGSRPCSHNAVGCQNAQRVGTLVTGCSTQRRKGRMLGDSSAGRYREGIRRWRRVLVRGVASRRVCLVGAAYTLQPAMKPYGR